MAALTSSPFSFSLSALAKGCGKAFILKVVSQVAFSRMARTSLQFMVSHGCLSNSLRVNLFFGSLVNIPIYCVVFPFEIFRKKRGYTLDAVTSLRGNSQPLNLSVIRLLIYSLPIVGLPSELSYMAKRSSDSSSNGA